ncbi:hypothetical protein [Saccharothrix sp. Mg75]|uniref:hypothetical protein n=1 Tax=Saccharothrix sp. Mg75 TaxID=3445357 RepID=UPI003EEF96B9
MTPTPHTCPDLHFSRTPRGPATPRGRRGLALAVAVAAAALCAACGSGPAGGEAAPAAASSPAAAPTTAANGGLSPTDVAWLELLIAQDESALALVGAMGDEWDAVASDYRRELARAREILAGAGAVDSRQHEGHDMPGMVPADELAAVSGGEVGRRVLRAQLEESAAVASAERSAGVAEDVVSLAVEVERSRAAHLEGLG